MEKVEGRLLHSMHELRWMVEDKTERERETKQTATQEQGGAWEHAPGIKGRLRQDEPTKGNRADCGL